VCGKELYKVKLNVCDKELYKVKLNVCGKELYKVKLNQSHYRPGVAQSVPGS